MDYSAHQQPPSIVQKADPEAAKRYLKERERLRQREEEERRKALIAESRLRASQTKQR
ncbi:hypothetical protein GCM10010038_18910 [Glutamicibacter protophormiae]|nr:hypothetical protein GCM10010038_18910 [Glutamicibacter protophormiae]